MIAVQLSQTLEELLKRKFHRPVAELARELLLIEAYKAGVMSAGTLAEELGLPTSIAALQWLAKRGVSMNYGTEDFSEDLTTLEQLRKRSKP